MINRCSVPRYCAPARRTAFAGVILLASIAAAHGDPLPVQEVAPGIFVRQGEIALMSEENRGGISNIGFIVGDEAVAMIDTGGSVADGEALLAAVRAQTPLPIRYVVNTHKHPDHVFGNAAFAAEGAEFVGSAMLPAALSRSGEHYLAAAGEQIGAALSAQLEIIPPTLLVEDRLELDLGGRTLLLQAWPAAHTDDDLTVLDLETGTLFAGDLVFLDHIPALDGSILGWLDVMDSLQAIGAERVVPGHGPASAPWPEALDPQGRYLAKVADEVRRLIAEGRSISEAPAAAAQDERPLWRLFDEFHARNVTAAFAELEWE